MARRGSAYPFGVAQCVPRKESAEVTASATLVVVGAPVCLAAWVWVEACPATLALLRALGCLAACVEACPATLALVSALGCLAACVEAWAGLA